MYRLRHLMFYDDAEQIEVRHVLSLEHFDVDIYGGGSTILEGELFVKRNCIRLRRSASVAPGGASNDSRPFYLFSDNCSQGEDFYHALIQNKQLASRHPKLNAAPLQFESDHMAKLVQLLHISGDNIQTRWINALLGRLFLSVYKTDNTERFIRSKIVKKVSRIQTPAFIRNVSVGRITMGDSAPLITNPKLKELTIDGDLTIEADVRYRGSFRLEISALARIELGSRFKAREVNLRLAGICRSLDGHLLLRVKPPPSNRLWISFETMPKVDISVEPIVSTRQITYGFILRAIESRIRDTIADTLVLPNWDDIPFMDTQGRSPRGGIWEGSQASNDVAPEEPIDAEASIPLDSPEELKKAAENDATSSLKAEDTTAERQASRRKPVRNKSIPDGLPGAYSDSIYDEPVSDSPSVSSLRSEGVESIPLDRADAGDGKSDSVLSSSPQPTGKFQDSTGTVHSRHNSRSYDSYESSQPPVDTLGSSTSRASSLQSPPAETLQEITKKSSNDGGLRLRSKKTTASGSENGSEENLPLPPAANTAPARSPSDPTKSSWRRPVPPRPQQFDDSPANTPSILVGRGRPLPPPGTPLPGPLPGPNGPNRAGKFGWTSPLGLMKRRNISIGSRGVLEAPAASSSAPNLNSPGMQAKDDSDTAESTTKEREAVPSGDAPKPREKPPLPPRRPDMVKARAPSYDPRLASATVHGRHRSFGGVDGDGLLVIQAPESGRESPVSDSELPFAMATNSERKRAPTPLHDAEGID